VTFILADTITKKEPSVLRKMNFLLRTLSLVVILMTGSRTGIVVIFLYLLVTWLPRFPVAPWLKVAGVLAVAATVSLIIFAPGPLEILGRGNPGQSTEQHVETRLSAVGIGLAHPLQGVGIGNIGPLLGEPPDRSSAHALPFTVFAEEGVTGLLLSLLALGFPFALMVRRFGVRAGLTLPLGVCVAIWLYDFMFILDVAAVWWAIALGGAVGVALERAPQRRRRLSTAFRNFLDRAKARPAYTADAPTAKTAARHAWPSTPPASRTAKYTVARTAATAPV
jgi:hypothetical protein